MVGKQIVSSIQRFIKAESASGALLFGATVLALVLSNLPTYDWYSSIWSYELGFKTEGFELVKPVLLWVNDGLMAVFFFLIGLEIKREVLIGELNSIRKASLPIFAALGGMIVPLSLFLFLNQNPETFQGWGIPMATDIAFTLAILKLAGKQVPLGLKIFLTAFAIIDDLGAVLVIAFFYTTTIGWSLLLYAGVLLGILYTLSFLKLYSKPILLFLGIIVWVLFLKAGIHPTIAGILLAFAVPIHQKLSDINYAQNIKQIGQQLLESGPSATKPLLTKQQLEEVDALEELTHNVRSPLQHMEHRLHTTVAYFIIPIFALANAGVHFSSDTNFDYSLVGSIAIALFLGKTVGVFGFSYVGIRFNLASLPENSTMKMIFGAAILSGVGFTMSLFIGGLAFSENMMYLNSAKIGIIAGSVVSGIVGFYVLKSAIKSQS